MTDDEKREYSHSVWDGIVPDDSREAVSCFKCHSPVIVFTYLDKQSAKCEECGNDNIVLRRDAAFGFDVTGE